MKLMDALFYWLQMKWISSARPDDEAAKETLLFFDRILSEDHELTSFDVSSVEPAKVYVTYAGRDGTTRTVWFDREAVEQLNRDMFGAEGVSADEDDEEESR